MGCTAWALSALTTIVLFSIWVLEAANPKSVNISSITSLRKVEAAPWFELLPISSWLNVAQILILSSLFDSMNASSDEYKHSKLSNLGEHINSESCPARVGSSLLYRNKS